MDQFGRQFFYFQEPSDRINELSPSVNILFESIEFFSDLSDAIAKDRFFGAVLCRQMNEPLIINLSGSVVLIRFFI
jgi:hypothetical protein